MLLQRVNSLLHGIGDAIAPARCIGCLRESSWFCLPCGQRAAIEFRRWQNAKQPKPPASLTRLVSAGAYQTPALKRGIAWLKFKSVRPVARVLAELMVPALEQIRPLAQLQKEAVLIPLPLHKARLAQRGFNQAEALATELAALTDIPVAHLLRRQRGTFRQTELPSNLRRQNVSGAFLPLPEGEWPFRAEGVGAKSIIVIIDDVTTTGATLGEAARTLREAGLVGSVYGATVARG